ncbi:MAG: ATP-binding protein [Bacteroidales bacterium]|nr:ATP-binding protein [Bacteroidales bacterium]
MYKRPYYQLVTNRIKEPRYRIQVVVGPRQVGKSTMIRQILEDCELPYASFTADDITNVSQNWLSEIWETQRMKMLAQNQQKRLLVIDEIQKIPNWSETVKAEWDRDSNENRNLLVVLLGSSRVLIQKGLTESLAGRFELIRLPHWSFSEMRDCFGWNLQQYVYFGGYPGAAAFISDEKRWRDYIKDSMIEPSISKDVIMDSQIQKPQLLRQLFELGASYSGELLSLTKVQGQLVDAGNVTTLAGYLHLLDECGLLAGLQKYAVDDARKYNSIPKFQVYNNALRNVYMEEDFSEAIQDSKIWGRYVESAIGAYLVANAAIYGYTVYYWRNKQDEVDFVLRRRQRTVALEVKTGRRTTNSGLKVFEDSYKPFRKLVIGSGGLPVEDFLTMDLEVLFKTV